MKTKVYFNNSCSICRTEINQYKKHCGDKIDWVDISSSQDAEKETNMKTDDLYRRMHVLENGKYKTSPVYCSHELSNLQLEQKTKTKT